MPFKSEKIKISGTEFDRRVKLNEEQREEIRNLYKTTVPSQRKLAIIYGVSKSLIAMIVNPEKKERCRMQFIERRKDGRYNSSKEQRAKIMKEHRRYKHNLYKEGKIQSDDNE